MTDTQTAPQKTDFAPQLEKIFDMAQENPVLVDLGGKETAILSEKIFARAVEAAATLEVELKSNRVDRGAKPAVVIVPYKQLEELLGLLDLAVDTHCT